MPKPHIMSIRLSDEGHALLEQFATEDGTSKAAQVELAIRDRARLRKRRIAPTPERREPAPEA